MWWCRAWGCRRGSILQAKDACKWPWCQINIRQKIIPHWPTDAFCFTVVVAFHLLFYRISNGIYFIPTHPPHLSHHLPIIPFTPISQLPPSHTCWWWKPLACLLIFKILHEEIISLERARQRVSESTLKKLKWREKRRCMSFGSCGECVQMENQRRVQIVRNTFFFIFVSCARCRWRHDKSLQSIKSL